MLITIVDEVEFNECFVGRGMQEGFMINCVYRKLAEAINKLVVGKEYDKYIFTRFINNPTHNSLYVDKLGWPKVQSEKECCFAVNIPTYCLVLDKYGYGLKNENLAVIKALYVEEIDICGIRSEACVYVVSLQLCDMGIFHNMLSNYVLGDIDMERVFVQQFGKVEK